MSLAIQSCFPPLSLDPSGPSGALSAADFQAALRAHHCGGHDNDQSRQSDPLGTLLSQLSDGVGQIENGVESLLSDATSLLSAAAPLVSEAASLAGAVAPLAAEAAPLLAAV
jgi:X-X-X-Leu-X-X-Gly heptad repeat protein